MSFNHIYTKSFIVGENAGITHPNGLTDSQSSLYSITTNTDKLVRFNEKTNTVIIHTQNTSQLYGKTGLQRLCLQRITASINVI